MNTKYLLLTIATAGVLPSVAIARTFPVIQSEMPAPVMDVTMQNAWGTQQVLGKPDTFMAGDMVTAWASLTEDGQDEWLLLTYKKSVVPKEVHIYETFNPGAVYRVTAFDGMKEVDVWTGTDPILRTAQMGIAKIPVNVSFRTRKIKVYLHSKDVAGWNEIDAVALMDTSGDVQWATKARASSTYASSAPPISEMYSPVVPYVDPLTERINQLEARIKALEDIIMKRK
jgi:hypothetical protein